MESSAPWTGLECQDCGSSIAPEDISPELAAARCKACDAWFAIPGASRNFIRQRPKIEMPSAFRVDAQIDGVLITRRWKNATAYALLFFTIFWNGFLIMWHGIALSKGAWMMSVFGLLHTAVGLFLLYFVLASFINSTFLRVSTYLIEIKSGPLPWPGDLSISTDEIAQLYCKEKVTYGKNGPSRRYSVEMVLKDDRRRTLLKGLPDADHALFIEQQIEKSLGLVDRRVEGEHAR